MGLRERSEWSLPPPPGQRCGLLVRDWSLPTKGLHPNRRLRSLPPPVGTLPVVETLLRNPTLPLPTLLVVAVRAEAAIKPSHAPT